MIIRRAKAKDIDRMIDLLQQVLEIHAEIRPDIFISGSTKYKRDELVEMIQDEQKPIYVATDDGDNLIGYAFCQIKDYPASNNTHPFRSLYIDDLCVDETCRGQHIGEALFEHMKAEAKRLDCYEVGLNVWAGNTKAEKFYEKMGMKPRSTQMEYII